MRASASSSKGRPELAAEGVANSRGPSPRGQSPDEPSDVCFCCAPHDPHLCSSTCDISYVMVGTVGMQRASLWDVEFKSKSVLIALCSMRATESASTALHTTLSCVASCHGVSSPRQRCPRLRRRRVGSERRGRTLCNVFRHHAPRLSAVLMRHLSSGFTDKRPEWPSRLPHKNAMACAAPSSSTCGHQPAILRASRICIDFTNRAPITSFGESPCTN